jgi:4-methyl-5(b-hydroxyethyl)-thiazole monophosphate biosynthesis
VGALPIGKSGLLKDKKGTTYNSPVRRAALSEFGVNVLHEPIVRDDNIITSWNPATAIDVALMLLEHLTNKDNAAHVRKLMGFESRQAQ